MPTPIELDAIDRHILTLLQQDAAQANQTLAAHVGVSPATALRRVRRLVESGVIQRQVALLDPAAVGVPLAAVVEVTLDRQGAEHLEAFEARAVAEPAVQQAWRVAPGPDFVLMVQVADMATFQALVQRLLTQDANVRNVKTYFAIKQAKFETALPVNTS
jgi:DNA-binding Lrp family transcriptional regulator